MFTFAFLIGFYAYLIYSLGLLGLLNKELIFTITVFYLALIFLWTHLNIKNLFSKPKVDLVTAFLFTLILLQAVINLIGALGPELGFDALWYHLTIPKIYLQEERIFYIGGILYYSAMPQLIEMYYLTSLVLGNVIVAKIIHFLFGILSLIALYKLARLFLSSRDSVLTTLIFYSNLVVGWMSITAYIDLARTFFEIMALWAFVNFVQSNRLKWLCASAAMVGFAISAKTLSIGSIVLYLLLFVYLKFSNKLKVRDVLKFTSIYIVISLTAASPWLLYSYLNTGNPIYPIFSQGFQQVSNPFSFDLIQLLKTTFKIFLLSPDPISPIYLICLPLIGLYFRKILFKKIPSEVILVINLLIIYVIAGLILLYLTPIESSGRFILPFLPAFSLLFILLLKNLNNKFLYNLLFIIIVVISLSSTLYRGAANKRFIPFLLGKITMSEFMAKNLEFQVGNFYDIDSYFQKTIKKEDKVLIYGISNLFYVNFPYMHESWARKDDKFNYILTKDIILPERFKDWQLVYQNSLTKVKLYSSEGPKK